MTSAPAGGVAFAGRPLVLLFTLVMLAVCGSPQPPAGSPPIAEAGAPVNPGAAGSAGSAGGSMGGAGGSAPTPAVPPVGGTGGGGPAPVDGGADGPAAVPPPAGTPVPLPIVVTDHFTNRGWFGDATIQKHFLPGSMLIREVASTSGPCAARPPGAKGACLEFTYTPPAGFAPPAMGAFLGVYMLTTLRMSHPTAVPPAKAGEPNWGLEPGLPVASGAKRVTFYAASAQPGLRVSFRAGIDRDSVTLPENTEVLGTEWKPISMSLAGGDTGGQLLGGFAWTYKDTGRPATFYLDGIVWDGEGVDPPRAPMGRQDGVRQVVVINQCKETVWVAIGSQMAVPDGGGFQLDAGQSRTLNIPGGMWSGRLWGRTGCTFDAAGTGRCATGDCGGRLGCGPVGGKTPATLAEITFSGSPQNPDFYDISLVDGYNLPMAMAPMPGSFRRSPGAAFDCLTPTCVSDLNATCPAELRVVEAGKVVGCLSACEKFNTDELCCRGAHNTPETCAPSSFARTFKAACPTAYSYAYDDPTSTFVCRGEDYAVWFCP